MPLFWGWIEGSRGVREVIVSADNYPEAYRKVEMLCDEKEFPRGVGMLESEPPEINPGHSTKV